MPKAFRILVVDDHEAVRLGVRAVLGSNPRWEICGEAGDGDEAVEKVHLLHPELVILDLNLPTQNGLEAAAEIRKIAPQTKIVYFTMHDLPVLAEHIGADAFVRKTSAAKDLPRALKRLLPDR